MAALTDLCLSDPTAAMTVLGLGPKQVDEVTRNARLQREPCGSAISVFSGVVFDSLGYRGLSRSQRTRADTSLLITSALFGLVRPNDLIPAHRLSGDVSLPGVGTMRSVWRQPLGSVLREVAGLVVDLRSGTYLELAPPPRTEDWLMVRVLQERGGRRVTVSHDNKSTKGRLAHDLLALRRGPEHTASLVTALCKAGYRLEHTEPGRIDVISD
jgi:cytoplasmic iron level regulating protein YaaA (DUF328/UPF0246 family)